jgi:hypothetical protein
VAIRDFPLEVEEYIKEKDASTPGIYDQFLIIIKQLQSDFLKYGIENLIVNKQTIKDENTANSENEPSDSIVQKHIFEDKKRLEI